MLSLTSLGSASALAIAALMLAVWLGSLARRDASLVDRFWGFGFVVVLRAEAKDAPWIVAIGGLGVLGGRFGAATLGVELGTFAGAFAVGLASSVYERLTQRPATVVSVPGILLLVPGSVGFRGLTSLLERQAVVGIETIFGMIITAVALVAGLLLAAAIAPEQRLSTPGGSQPLH